ncbi:DEAD/DEAH box helicase [Bacillus velezensis]|uniref:DEAD/DEAH box helicase family protein n=1 Tax=Bacillus TaxID=1386 RepID=UPI00111D8F09|nr:MULTISPECIES: DEAD/DEAH box helicase family protein [Bacillus amyloliquefaciens group]NMV99599.1 DEAD/DEAH box helicase family protein [Bacillus velezensis]TNU61719.1 DEAD/DEAH box helicase [Bacillus velezensis]USP43507.1 DEAD/DEAH box helicase family protein [Bacillus amyloliquefaciens]
MVKEILHSRIEKRFNDIFEAPPEVPAYISDNLKHKMRPYQEIALQQFIYTQRSNTADVSFNHLLFHMATGSGKTQVLAATILYLYKEKSYQNFIFFVNSDAIIKKTYNNLTNTTSSKYLFDKSGIVIDGEKTNIQIVDVFPVIPAENTIYLKLTTIQKLHTDLTNPGENKITFDSLQEMKIVLLADEAHHINTLTKSNKKKLSTKEVEERTWESTVNKLLGLNPLNRLVEFTATIDLENDDLFNKYCNKIVYQYDLKRFMEDGYSKNVVLLRSNENDSSKMLNALLLSQYRKYIARDNGIELKPIILFKSNKIAISLEANNTFLALVESLTVDQIEKVIKNGLTIYQTENSIWRKIYQYYIGKDLGQVIRDLQWDFTKETTLNANDKSLLSEKNALLLNTLEDLNNPIRAIFAVAKLNEGWDVLNLFDIVRISEGSSGTKTTTDSEAQLIGRGARYYPFAYAGEFSYKRRFDLTGNDLKVIETLHYHTINESAYIRNLEKSLEAAEIQVKEDQYEKLEAKVKSKIRKKDFFKGGKIYINRVVPTTASDYLSLKDYGISYSHLVEYDAAVEKKYGSKQETRSGTKKYEERLEIDRRLLRKGIQRNKFYRFNNLKEYVPSIKSMRDFIQGPHFLGSITINVSLPIGLSAMDLTAKEKLDIVENFLSECERKIRENYMKERGTTVFEGVALSKLIDDYAIEINKVNTKVQVNQIIRSRNMRDHDWYVYDNAIVNGLENEMIDFIIDFVDQLKKKYSEVYLIRNERKVKLVEFNGTRGFMPDFLLYLKDDEFTYQVFLEPKGDNLIIQDKWKEDFLMAISNNEEVVVLGENEHIKLHGIKFYSNHPEFKQAFKKDFTGKLLGDDFLGKDIE